MTIKIDAQGTLYTRFVAKISRNILLLRELDHGHVDGDKWSSLKLHLTNRVSRYSSRFNPSSGAKLAPLIRLKNCRNDLPRVEAELYSCFMMLTEMAS